MAIYGPGGGGSSGGDVTGGSASSTGELAAYSDTSGKAIGRSFAILSGPATSTKTYTVPNSNSTLMVGTTGATDNAILRADGTGGGTVQTSLVIIGDGGEVSGASSLSINSGLLQMGSFGIVSGNGAGLSFNGLGATAALAGDFGTNGLVMYLGGGHLVSFDGLTSSFPAVKRSGTTLQHRLGDDSADGPMSASGATLSSATVPLTFSNAAFQGCTALSTSAGGVLVCTVSDVRLKDVIGPSSEGLDAILAITPQKFTWKDGRRVGVQSGLIAQDVQAAIPLGVSATGDGYLQLEKDAIIGALVNAVKELHATVEDLRSQVLGLSASKG